MPKNTNMQKYKCAEFHFIKNMKEQFHNSISFRRGLRGRTNIRPKGEYTWNNHRLFYKRCSTSWHQRCLEPGFPVRKLINALNYLKK